MQSAASYDREASDRRNIRRVGFWFAAFVLGSFAFAYGWNLYIGPYSKFYEDRAIEQRKARAYLLTTTCTDATMRSQLEGYNHCERSERITNQRLTVMAFFDLMDYLRICDKGICTIGGINITSSAWFLFQLIIATAAILYIVSFFGLASSMYGRQVGMHQMPMTMSGANMAAMYQVQLEQMKQAAAAGHPPMQLAASQQYSAPFTSSTVYDAHSGKQE